MGATPLLSLRPRRARYDRYRHAPLRHLSLYVCVTVFLVGSLLRYDRDQYTWKSDSSQLLRSGTLRCGSNLFHIGVLFLLFGHFFGMLTPHFVYEPFISAGTKQIVAMVSGGIAGLLALIGVTLLLRRRLGDPRIRATSKTSDIVLLVLLWVQLFLGLGTIPLSAQHLDGVSWVFKAHMVLGMTVFLIFPLTRLVHVWSGFASLAYALRPWQLVRDRRMNLPAGRQVPQQQRRG